MHVDIWWSKVSQSGVQNDFSKYKMWSPDSRFLYVYNKQSRGRTWAGNEAGCVHFTNEKLQADNSIDDDDKQDQEGDVKERDHGFDDGVQHHL